METINGEWIMLGCDRNDPTCLNSPEDLRSLIKSAGFLPLFSTAIPGFSVEEHVPAYCWWTGDPATDPWEWRQILAKDPDIAYGKFFERKAGFISREWFPAFANCRRNGYDFDSLYEDGLAPHRAKKLMDVFELDDDAVGKELMSFEAKALAGFGKRADGQAGEKNFEGVLTDLQMQTYLIMSDFHQKRNKNDEPYGWHIAALETPETKWGYKHVTSSYKEKPVDSWNAICDQMRRLYPEATERMIRKVVGYRAPGGK